MKYFYLIFTIFLVGCGSSTSSSSSNEVEVFTTAPVFNALVKDSNNQVATFDANRSVYIFQNSIKYPIYAYPNDETFIDVDYDHKKTAADIKPSFSVLKSYNNQINYLTNLYYTQEYNLSGITPLYYSKLINDKFNVNSYNKASNDVNLAKVLFAAYNYTIETKTNLTNLNQIDPYLDKINVFFQTYLSTFSDKIEYYSFYNSLVELDKHNIQRIDTLHKPNITILRDKIYLLSNNSIDVFDIAINNNYLYTASGHDELGLFDINLNFLSHSNADLLSFGRDLYKEDYDNACLFLANSYDGFKVFNLNNNDINETDHIFSYKDDNKDINFTNNNIIEINGFISAQKSKRLLTISTDDKGFYLLNTKDILNNCKFSEINTSNMLITSEGNKTISTAFRNDGAYLYTSTDNNITGFNLEILTTDKILDSKYSIIPKNSEKPYNLLLVNNDNELFVSTNKGVQVYDIDNANNLSFVSEYTTEGAKDDYYPKMDWYGNYLFFTDGYKGLKVIKYDDSFNPMLCGVEYFAPLNNPEELAKVNSIKYDNGFLYVGIDSYGLVKFNMEDILFRHCKE